MKTLYLFLLILPLSFWYTDAIDTTADLLRKGQIHELAKTFSASVELTILNEDHTYTNAQAEAALNEFFRSRSPKSVSILHRISSNSIYNLGVLVLITNDSAYRISFSLKKVNGRFELYEMRIEAEKTK